MANVDFPIDRLGVVNSALLITGNEPRTAENDGSDEWAVCSAAYESALPYALEGFDWKFGTAIKTLQRVGASPDAVFTDAYAKPADCLHIIWVRVADIPADYKIIGNQICLDTFGGAVTAKCVIAPTIDLVTPIFAMGLRAFVMSGIYRGLHEDTVEADKMWQAGEQFMLKAAARSDQEQPKRAFFTSRLLWSRRVRRPFRGTPTNFGGTGSPS